MSSHSSVPKPVVTPGPTPHGPPGWEEKQQERLASGVLTNEKQSSNYHDDVVPDAQTDTGEKTISHLETSDLSGDHKKTSGLAKMKQKMHHVGEKLALVPPTEEDEHGNPLERSAHRQVSRSSHIVAETHRLTSASGCINNAGVGTPEFSSTVTIVYHTLALHL